jgi:hypothetical protein
MLGFEGENALNLLDIGNVKLKDCLDTLEIKLSLRDLMESRDKTVSKSDIICSIKERLHGLDKSKLYLSKAILKLAKIPRRKMFSRNPEFSRQFINYFFDYDKCDIQKVYQFDESFGKEGPYLTKTLNKRCGDKKSIRSTIDRKKPDEKKNEDFEEDQTMFLD